MSAQGLLSSVFSCSLSPKTISKRRLRQTRSLDAALMRHSTEAEETLSEVSDLMALIGDVRLDCLKCQTASRNPELPNMCGFVYLLSNI